jgi:hypothetical protein
VRVSCLVAVWLLAGCGGQPASSTSHADDATAATATAHQPPATTTTAARTSAKGPQLNPLEKAVVRALRAADPTAARTEHGFEDAHATAKIDGDRVVVDIPSPGFTGRGKVRRTVRYSSVRTQAVALPYVGLTWRFACRLKRFGAREVNLSSVARPRRVVPVVYRLLGCAPAPLPVPKRTS